MILLLATVAIDILLISIDSHAIDLKIRSRDYLQLLETQRYRGRHNLRGRSDFIPIDL
jgi:hypothetical protein